MHLSDEVVATLPCEVPLDPGEKQRRQFCVGKSRVVHTYPPSNSFFATLEVFDRQTGDRLHSFRILGWGVGLDDERLYFGLGENLHFIPVNRPTSPPKSLGTCVCGTEGSPYGWAVSAGRVLCYLEHEDGHYPPVPRSGPRRQQVLEFFWGLARSPEEVDALRATGFQREMCILPQSQWRKTPRGYAISPEKLSALCKRVLGMAAR